MRAGGIFRFLFSCALPATFVSFSIVPLPPPSSSPPSLFPSHVHSPPPSFLAHAGWHLDHVEVVDNATGIEYYFPCGLWFDRSEGDGLLERTLMVAPKDPR